MGDGFLHLMSVEGKPLAPPPKPTRRALYERMAAGLAASEYQPKDIHDRLRLMPENHKERNACER